MKPLTTLKRCCICAACIALCYVLPLAFHAAGVGAILTPMHIPVLLCGMLCGWQYGLLCGVAGPFLSSLLSGMPPAAKLVSMVPELALYGLVCGLLLRFIHTKSTYADLYFAMLPAMLLGRVAGGIAQAVFYLSGNGKPITVGIWASSYFVTTLPGTLVQLVLLPTLVVLLMKARLIPLRYPPRNRQ